MSLSSVLDTRFATWVQQLDFHGYDILEPAWGTYDPDTTIAIRARRAAPNGRPAADDDGLRDVEAGADPELGLDAQGCHLDAGSWAAVIDPVLPDNAGVDRFEVDRVVHPEEPLHRHPFGMPDTHFVPWAPVPNPEQWIQLVEEIAFAGS